MDPEPSKVQRVAAEVAHVVIRFLKARLGRGPEGFRTYLIDNMILIRLFKVLTPVEYEHAKTAEGRRPLKETRSRLIEDVRPSVEEVIRNSTGAKVISLHSDLSAKTGEAVVVFVLDHAIRDLAGT
jgi:uncharacterized protein YbcI